MFLECLFASAGFGGQTPSDLTLRRRPSCEVVTKSNKRIDILVEGNDWVLAIENKIRHAVQNPFEDYEQHISEAFPDAQRYLIILAPSPTTQIPNWRNVSYQEFISPVKKRLMDQFFSEPFSKWFILAREFLNNLEEQTVDSKMTADQITFLEKNYVQISKMIRLQEAYHDLLQKKGQQALQEVLPGRDFKTRVHVWKRGPAIRFYCDEWGDGANIALQPSQKEDDPGIRIYLFVTKAAEKRFAENMTSWSESKDEIGFKTRTRYDNHLGAIEAFKEIAQSFDEFQKEYVELTP